MEAVAPFLISCITITTAVVLILLIWFSFETNANHSEREEARLERERQRQRRNAKALRPFGDFTHWSKGQPLRQGEHKDCQPVVYQWGNPGWRYPMISHPHHPTQRVSLGSLILVPSCADEHGDVCRLSIHHLPYDKLHLRPVSSKKASEKSHEEDGMATLYVDENGRTVWEA